VRGRHFRHKVAYQKCRGTWRSAVQARALCVTQTPVSMLLCSATSSLLMTRDVPLPAISEDSAALQCAVCGCGIHCCAACATDWIRQPVFCSSGQHLSFRDSFPLYMTPRCPAHAECAADKLQPHRAHQHGATLAAACTIMVSGVAAGDQRVWLIGRVLSSHRTHPYSSTGLRWAMRQGQVCAPMSRPLQHRRQRLPCKPRHRSRSCRPRSALLAPAPRQLAVGSDTGTMSRCCEHADAGLGRRRGSAPGSALATHPRLRSGCAAVHARPWPGRQYEEADARHADSVCCARAHINSVRVACLQAIIRSEFGTQ